MKTIQWYPGHMAKARRILIDDLKLVDVVVEVLDARLPHSSANPVLSEIIGQRPRVVVLNKSDLADPQVTSAWINYFASVHLTAIPFNAADGRGIKSLVKQIAIAGAAALEKLEKKGLRPRPLRIMVVGIPNVGKSSLINRLVGSASAKTGDKPGVTRGRQWVRVAANLDLLDTPGIMPPSLPDQQSAMRLSISGAIQDNVFDVTEAVLALITFLAGRYPDRFSRRYLKGKEPVAGDPAQILAAAAAAQGLLGRDGVVFSENMARMILADFRFGRLGPISLETPDEKPNR